VSACTCTSSSLVGGYQRLPEQALLFSLFSVQAASWLVVQHAKSGWYAQ
jgi:hypothetical protein